MSETPDPLTQRLAARLAHLRSLTPHEQYLHTALIEDVAEAAAEIDRLRAALAAAQAERVPMPKGKIGAAVTGLRALARAVGQIEHGTLLRDAAEFLDSESRAANHWFTEANTEHNRAEAAEARADAAERLAADRLDTIQNSTLLIEAAERALREPQRKLTEIETRMNAIYMKPHTSKETRLVLTDLGAVLLSHGCGETALAAPVAPTEGK